MSLALFYGNFFCSATNNNNENKTFKKKKQHLNCLNYNMLEIEIARLRHLRTIISVIINENQEQL